MNKKWIEDIETLDSNVFAGMEFDLMLDKATSRIVVNIDDDGREWCIEYPMVDGGIDISRIEEPVGQGFVESLLDNRPDEVYRVFYSDVMSNGITKEEREDLSCLVEIDLMEKINFASKLINYI